MRIKQKHLGLKISPDLTLHKIQANNLKPESNYIKEISFHDSLIKNIGKKQFLT